MNHSIGTGYIALPNDIDRDEYISLCYKTSSVSIRLDDGAYYNRAPISSPILDFLRFPDTVKELGSPVVLINNVQNDGVIVIGILPEPHSITDRRENDFKIQRSLDDCTVEITGNPESKHIGISLQSSSKGGQVYINVTNPNKDSKLKIHVTGDIDIYSTTQKITSETQIEVITGDNSFKQTTEEQNFTSSKFTLNKGSEAMVLGNTLSSLLSDILSTMAALIITTPSGPGAVDPGSITKIETLKTQLNNILSSKGFLD